jgi:deazaflavin-dependent oxidoreductase (nitroreductase family)
VLDLTTTGRVSGRLRTIEIWFTQHQNKLYLNAEQGYRAQWVRNLLAHPEVLIRLQDVELSGRARVLDPTADRELWDIVTALSRQKYGWGEGLPVEIAILPGERA